MEEFLMAHPEGYRSFVSDLKTKTPNKMELSTSLLSPFHLLAALLERDKHFASMIIPEKAPASSAIGLIDDKVARVLDRQ